MKLYKALKLKKSLIGEIAVLKAQIQNKNSYLSGNNTPDKFNTKELFNTLESKVEQLVKLKLAIAIANVGIQKDIFLMSELKATIVFLKGLNIREGQDPYSSEASRVYIAQIDELERDRQVVQLQSQIDTIQENIDVYNHTQSI